MTDAKQCPLCDKVTPPFGLHASADNAIVRCPTCGDFEIENTVIELGGLQQRKAKRYLLSSLTKNSATRATIDKEVLKKLDDGKFVDPPIPKKIETIVRWIADQSNEIGAKIAIRSFNSYPIATCKTEREFTVLVDEAIKRGLLTGQTQEVAVTVKGWGWLTERPNATSPTAFVAMPFAQTFDKLADAIFIAVRAAGYDPVRVDKEDYLGGVMDKIIALIRTSRFVVADFTGNRGGVYYEAGFAFGLGLPVVQVCEETQLSSSESSIRLHFDVNHLNFIGWNKDGLGDFSERLKNRIIAVLGRGPLVQ